MSKTVIYNSRMLHFTVKLFCEKLHSNKGNSYKKEQLLKIYGSMEISQNGFFMIYQPHLQWACQ